MKKKLRGCLFITGVLVTLVLAVMGVASIPRLLSGEPTHPATDTEAETQQPTALPPVAATPTAAQTGETCPNHGTIAWQNDNQVSGAVYGEAPIGGLEEECWIVAQTWWRNADGTHTRAVFAVRPHTVVWLSGHLGGTGWFFDGTLEEIQENLTEQAKQLEERDGPMTTLLVFLPDQHTSFPLVTRFTQR